MGKHSTVFCKRNITKGEFLMTSCYSCVWGHHSILISKAKARVFQTKQNCYLGVITETVIARITHTFSNKQTKIPELKIWAQRPFLIKKLHRILTGRGKINFLQCSITAHNTKPSGLTTCPGGVGPLKTDSLSCFVFFWASLYYCFLFLEGSFNDTHREREITKLFE